MCVSAIPRSRKTIRPKYIPANTVRLWLLSRGRGEYEYGGMGRAIVSISAGFIAFGLCSVWGLRLLLRGVRGEILDSTGMETASRSCFIVGGILLQFPLIAFTLFAWKQGFFGS